MKILGFCWGILTFRQLKFTLKLISLLILLNYSTAKAEVAHWKQLKTAANKCYSGVDLDVKVEGGIKAQQDDDSDRETFGKIVLGIPLLSKAERTDRITARNQFLNMGITVIREIEETQGLMDLKCEHVELLKKIGQEKGFDSLEKIMAAQETIEKLEAQHTAAERKLEGYLQCSEKLE